MNVINDVEVPESALLQVEQVNRFGSVPGLADEDLLGPDELERQVYRAEFGPILDLPFQGSRRWMQPVIDQEGRVDWGAFGTVDFERIQSFDKARYKADKLRERLKDITIILGIIKDRLPGKAKYLILKYLRMGIIDMAHIVNEDMHSLARRYLQARKLRDEIQQLEQEAQKRQHKALDI